MSYNCPSDHQDGKDETGNQFATFGAPSMPVSDTSTVLDLDNVLVSDTQAPIVTGRARMTACGLAWYEVLLDNQADISVVHLRLLYNLR